MEKPRYTYEQLNGTLKHSLLAHNTTRWTLKGSANPEHDAINDLLRKKIPMKRWRFLRYVFMRSIDQKRKALGLEPFFNVENPAPNELSGESRKTHPL